MFPPQSTPSKRPKRRVESYRIYKRPYSACSQSSRLSPSRYEKATHGKLVGPTLSTPRGDKYYNQYRPLCEVCPRDCGKEVGTLPGLLFSSAKIFKKGSEFDTNQCGPRSNYSCSLIWALSFCIYTYIVSTIIDNYL